MIIAFFFFFFFNDTATTEIYTLSLHYALPISASVSGRVLSRFTWISDTTSGISLPWSPGGCGGLRSEEHTSELQSRGHLVCRLLLEKKKKKKENQHIVKKNKLQQK